MLISELIEIWGLGPMAPLGRGGEYLAMVFDRAGVAMALEAGSWAVVLDETSTVSADSVGDFVMMLPEVEASTRGVILVAGSPPAKLPFHMLAAGLASFGYVIDTVAAMDYTTVGAAIVVRMGVPSPVVLPAIGPIAPSGFSDRTYRELTSMWMLDRFFSPVLSVTEVVRAAEDPAATLVRQELRVRSEMASELERILREGAELAETLNRERRELALVRKSPSFLVGRMIAESFKRPSRAFRAARLLARPTPLNLRLAQPPELQNPDATAGRGKTLKRLRRPVPRFGHRGPRVLMLAQPDRTNAWSECAIVSRPMPGESLYAFELTQPDLVVIEASGVQAGPWVGVGAGEDYTRSAELLDLIDIAKSCRVPTVFIWDLPFGSVSGAAQLARAMDIEVTTASEFATHVDLILEPGFAVAQSARKAFDFGPPASRVLAVGSDVSLGELTVDMASYDDIVYRRPFEAADYGLQWFSSGLPSRLPAEAAARGAAIVAPENELQVAGFRRPRDYRRLSGSDRQAAAADQMKVAWTSLNQTQRHLFVRHGVSRELSDVARIVGGVEVVASSLGIVFVGDSLSPEIASGWLRDHADFQGLMVAERFETLTSSVTPGGQLVWAADEAAMLEVIKSSDLAHWLVAVAQEADAWDDPNLSVDAVRFLSYGYGSVAWVSDVGPPPVVLIQRERLMRWLGSGPVDWSVTLSNARVDLELNAAAMRHTG